jgi:hypothetical protein
LSQVSFYTRDHLPMLPSLFWNCRSVALFVIPVFWEH